ncbi:MAG: DUF4402 domain-containing protein [Croceibacterium sp.]
MSKILRYAAAGMAMASLGVASTANAATFDQADVTAEILTALSVTVDPTDDTLDFGTIAPGASAATVVVAANGTLTSCPVAVICAGATNAPTFDVVGNPSALVYVTFTNATETLTSGANTMSVGTFTTDAGVGNQLTLDGAGAGSFTVGGSLAVAASQPAGVYTGTLEVNVAYN